MRKLYLSVCLVVLCMLQSFGQVPVLNSYSSAAPVIFLDFDGHYVSGTSWNWNGPFACGPANMTTTQIREIFSRVAEDYRPFNINVTTDSTRYWAAPVKSRMRVVLTITNAWYGSSAGGVASTSSFSRGDNTPCFVFTKLLNYNTKMVAEAAAHEAGHTLGLRHQAVYDQTCLRVADYNEGVGAGEASWAPIMGNGYYRNVTTWHVGTSSRSCTSIQSDLDVITSLANGVTYRPDDHSDDPVAATPSPFIGESLIAEGLIGQPTDNDYFALTVKKVSSFHLEARPYSIGSNNTGANLNVKVSLLDVNQKEITNFYSANRLDKTIDTVLAPGNYFLKVDGGAGQYFSDYGSLGYYSLKGELTTAMVLPLRKLSLQGVANGDAHLLRWEIDADETIVRQEPEMSADGSRFTSLGEADPNLKQWQQSAANAGPVQYRLRVLFSNGQQHLSNTITLRGNLAAKDQPRLAATLVTSTSIMMISPVAFRYQIADMSGKVVLRGSADGGSSGVQAGTLAPGMYLVRFSWQGGERVEKLLKK